MEVIQISRIAIDIYSIWLIKIFLDEFFRRKKLSKTNVWSWSICLIWQIFYPMFPHDIPGVNLLINISIMLLIVIVCYNGEIQAKILYGMVFNMFWIVSELIIGFILTIRNNNYLDFILYGSILSKLLLTCFIGIICSLRQKCSFEKISVLNWVPLVMIPVLGMFVVWDINRLNNIIHGNNITLEAISACIAVLIISVVAFNLYGKLIKEMDMRRKNVYYENLLKITEKHLQARESDIEYIRQVQHDLKHHNLYVCNLLKNKEYATLEKYLEQTLVREKALTVLNTGNTLIDSILNYKYDIAITKGIKMDMNIHISESAPIQGVDMAVLLGNLLDNAIEATEKMEIEKRKITIKMRQTNSILLIEIANTFKNIVQRNSKGQFVSQKENVLEHGLGIFSVEKIVHKHDGELKIEHEAEIFTVTILLYLQEN